MQANHEFNSQFYLRHVIATPREESLMKAKRRWASVASGGNVDGALRYVGAQPFCMLPRGRMLTHDGTERFVVIVVHK